MIETISRQYSCLRGVSSAGDADLQQSLSSRVRIPTRKDEVAGGASPRCRRMRGGIGRTGRGGRGGRDRRSGRRGDRQRNRLSRFGCRWEGVAGVWIGAEIGERLERDAQSRAISAGQRAITENVVVAGPAVIGVAASSCRGARSRMRRADPAASSPIRS